MFIRYGIILLPLLAFLKASDSSKMNGGKEDLLQRDTPVEEAQFVPQTAGPSGKLIKPGGGSVYQNHVSNVGAVEVIYTGVSDGSNEYNARTCTIDLHLVPKSAKGTGRQAFNVTAPSATSLAYGMRPHDSGSDQPIRASFVPPVGACGDYYLVVYERQLFQDTVIHFQSAAPLITFKCAGPVRTTIVVD
ncbi:hypothetical protein DFH28DRAFT_244418 [Melampsora americana]|nr:hypothetical protein DFH28DRAFT_278735 [Melampsora americana]KAH9824389.1 hypothetical protein DFH28DRAFT_244418 [Melampsora americana]